jgi:small subunit ribosomal protein S6
LNIYEGMFIFDEALRDEAMDAVLETVRADMERYGAQIETCRVLGRRSFARPMKKRSAGVYVRVVFKLDPAKMAELLARYKLNDDVVRVQIVVGDEKSLELDVPEPVEAAEEQPAAAEE